MSHARAVRARFAPELAVRLRLTAGLIYHAPYEHGVVRISATWRGRPLARARVSVAIECAGSRHRFRRRTGRAGDATVTYGTEMPNLVRLYTCPVTASVSGRGLSAKTGPGFLHFIHPLWLHARPAHGGRIVVRVWGRVGKLFEIHANDRIVGSGRIGRDGWADVSPPGLAHGDLVWVRGSDGLASHLIVV